MDITQRPKRKLTAKQRDRVLYYAAKPGAALYKATSMTGQSETLRVRYHEVQETRYGRRAYQRSAMLLSVTIRVLPDGRDDPSDLARFYAKCEEAEALFTAARSGN